MEPRRFLLMKSGYEVNILWLDSHGSCQHADSDGSIYHQRWHMVRGADGKVYTRICPNGLQRDEWARVFTDDPPGIWTKHFSEYREGPPKRTAVEEQ